MSDAAQAREAASPSPRAHWPCVQRQDGQDGRRRGGPLQDGPDVQEVRPRRRKYKAHDEKNEFRTGDRVEILEHRPLSKNKRWTVTRLIERPVGAE